VMPFWAWRWDAEHGLASIFLSSERNAGRRGGWFPAVAPPSTGETLSWRELSPSMLRLQWGQMGSRTMSSRGRVESPFMSPRGG
jgi:hypothetical protein